MIAAAILPRYDAIARWLGSRLPEGLALLLVRVALAGVFWRSGRTKVLEGTWLTISDTTHELFRTEYAGVPLPPDLAAMLATGAEHVLPILLVLGLFTRFAALGLIGMTMTIQIFVYPEAWWPEHSLWTALAAILVARGGGLFALDQVLLGSSRRSLALP